ncbi:MAG TPA: hypothetical protein VNJ28_05205 [Candidatus Limnocylindrales bacterium]|nr:hypothetical protein [Candidatus Limnocylindrales bacterium]
MTVLALPALRSHDPLGVLAALGLFEIAKSCLHLPEDELALGWDGVGGPALFGSPIDDVEELADQLFRLAVRTHESGAALALGGPDLLPERRSKAETAALKAAGVAVRNEPLEVSREVAVAQWSSVQEAELAGDHTAARWLAGLVNQMSVDRNSRFCELTPLRAARGQQTLRQVYRKQLAEVASRPDLLREALLGWRRRPGVVGANLDWREIRDATVEPSGDARDVAIPGATWLALHAFPWFRLGGTTSSPFAIGWALARGSDEAFVWPVWRSPLGAEGIQVLLEHRLVRVAALNDEERPADVDRRLAVLGVEAVFVSRRGRLMNAKGPLGRPELRWPRRPPAARRSAA